LRKNEVRDVWDANAEFWDSKMGEGNEFHKTLIEPIQLRLLDIQPGQRILDLACGNGQFARKMASLGAVVIAADFSENLITIARRKSDSAVTYEVADLTRTADLKKLAKSGPYDAAVCTMALMDVADIKPVALYLPTLLKTGGRFVFSITHPCFNSGSYVKVHENEETSDGAIIDTYSIKVRDYLIEQENKGVAIVGQPQPQLYFHRSLTVLLGIFFKQGLVLDALEEPSFAEAEKSERLFLNVYRNIPPALVCRLRLMT
jgi:SAM-dependent methyltransferase